MHAAIDVRFTISIDEDKTVPLATLAEFITKQNIEYVLPDWGCLEFSRTAVQRDVDGNVEIVEDGVVQLTVDEQARNALLTEFRLRVGHLVDWLHGIGGV